MNKLQQLLTEHLDKLNYKLAGRIDYLNVIRVEKDSCLVRLPIKRKDSSVINESCIVTLGTDSLTFCIENPHLVPARFEVTDCNPMELAGQQLIATFDVDSWLYGNIKTDLVELKDGEKSIEEWWTIYNLLAEKMTKDFVLMDAYEIKGLTENTDLDALTYRIPEELSQSLRKPSVDQILHYVSTITSKPFYFSYETETVDNDVFNYFIILEKPNLTNPMSAFDDYLCLKLLITHDK